MLERLVIYTQFKFVAVLHDAQRIPPDWKGEQEHALVSVLTKRYTISKKLSEQKSTYELFS